MNHEVKKKGFIGIKVGIAIMVVLLLNSIFVGWFTGWFLAPLTAANLVLFIISLISAIRYHRLLKDS